MGNIPNFLKHCKFNFIKLSIFVIPRGTDCQGFEDEIVGVDSFGKIICKFKKMYHLDGAISNIKFRISQS